jgi:hypothetical protein
VAAVLGLILVLTVGWSLINTNLPNQQRLAENTTLRVGPFATDGGQTTLPGAGWRVSQSNSDPQTAYQLAVGAVGVSLTYIVLPFPEAADNLWAGQDALSALDGLRVGEPTTVTGSTGLYGQKAPAIMGDRSGSMVIFVSPNRSYAIAVTALADRTASAADRAAAHRAQLAVSFTGPRD